MTAFSTTDSYIGVGRVFINGKLLSNAAEFKVNLKQDIKELYESMTTAKGLTDRVAIRNGGEFSMKLTGWSPDVWAQAVHGSVITNATGTVTDENIGTPTLGQWKELANTNVSGVSITENGVTLVEDTDYTVSLKHGSITALRAGTANWLVDYTKGASYSVGLFTQVGNAVELVFEGTNLATNTSAKYLKFKGFKCVFLPTKNIDFITEDFNGFDLEGALLADLGRVGNLGNYGNATFSG